MSKKTIVAFSSHVARGSVGLRASALALEALGNEVWSVPTVLLPHHPGHGPVAPVVTTDDDFESLVEGLKKPEWIGAIDAVFCGYFASPEQVTIVRDFHAGLPGDVPLIVDPVIGDHGRLYVKEVIAQAIRDTLVRDAQIITPNRFELEWLSNSPATQTNEQLVDLSKALLPNGTVVVTSAHGIRNNSIGSLCINGSAAVLAEHTSFDHPPNGLGDLTAALFTHHTLQGLRSEVALERSISSVAEVLSRTRAADADELAIESNLRSLHQPATRVHVSRILQRARKAD